jgi:hypothetical protein
VRAVSEHLEVGRDAGVNEVAGVVDVLVEQTVEVPDRDERGGQAVQIIGARRLMAALVSPAKGGVAVFDRSRKPGLGRETVADRDSDAVPTDHQDRADDEREEHVGRLAGGDESAEERR